MPVSTEHGLSEYRRGCRCDVCRGARAQYDRERSPRPFRNRSTGLPEQCSIDGCGRAAYSRKGSPDGWCRSHHMSWLKYADPLVGFQRAFEERVDSKAGPSGCWLWTGGALPNGYGQFHNQYPHRISYEFYVGPIPETLQLDHICHNRLCVNPAHLRPVTGKQNRENRQGAQSNSKTGVRGVMREGNRFLARVRHNGQDFRAGTYTTVGEAAEAARLKRLELFTHSDMDRQAV